MHWHEENWFVKWIETKRARDGWERWRRGRREGDAVVADDVDAKTLPVAGERQVDGAVDGI